jgi:lipopolysaccharide/colanic/teichoic acid biosynthesis glycosyltransferase
VRYLKKGYDVALKVAERVSALGLPVHIRIGGSQYTGETNLADEISRRGLSAVVSFEGTIEAPDAFLDSCDAFLLLSRFEGMPNALMEAMALGMPCISTDVGDVAEFRKHSDCVCVVPVLDVAAVADQLRDWLENWRGAEELGRRAHQFAAEQFAVSTMLDRVEAAFGWRDSLQTVVHVTTVAMTLPFLRGLFRHLAAQGIVVHAVAAGEPFLDTFGAEAGVSCHSIALTRSISPLADVRGFWSLYRLFRRIRPDVVHAHTPKAGMLATAAARLARVRGIVYTIHGLPFTAATGFRRRLLKACERVSCGCARRVLCVSRSMLATAHDERLASARKLTVIGEGSVGGIDTDDRFNPARHAEDGRAWRATHGVSADAVVVTFIGRLTRDKGVVELHHAWQIVRRRQPRARLVVVGPLDSTEPEIQAMVSQFSADDTVRVVGLDWNAPPILAASDVLCLPTYREGFPVTLLEAAAMAVPVVATTVPGCVDAVIDGVTGTLVPPRNAGALAEALEAYIEDAPLRAAHGAAARRRAQESFQPEPIWTGTTAVYRQLLRPQGATLYARGFKRVLDVFLSATALVVLAPIFAITAAGVALAMGTPVLFRQARPGLGGRLFTLVKFRSMRVSDQAAQADAERLTAFGRLLRASSLDELPELWNVLKGDMSLVGPRPLLVQYLDRYTPEQGRRHEVRPGITGLAQVNGRNALSWDAKFELDVWYVDHCSFALDLKILALTVWQVFARRGITQAGHATAAEFMGPTR